MPGIDTPKTREAEVNPWDIQWLECSSAKCKKAAQKLESSPSFSPKEATLANPKYVERLLSQNTLKPWEQWYKKTLDKKKQTSSPETPDRQNTSKTTTRPSRTDRSDYQDRPQAESTKNNTKDSQSPQKIDTDKLRAETYSQAGGNANNPSVIKATSRMRGEVAKGTPYVLWSQRWWYDCSWFLNAAFDRNEWLDSSGIYHNKAQKIDIGQVNAWDVLYRPPRRAGRWRGKRGHKEYGHICMATGPAQRVWNWWQVQVIEAASKKTWLIEHTRFFPDRWAYSAGRLKLGGRQQADQAV